MREFDAVVIGGGPAGLFAAITLSRAQVPTLLCEARGFPVDKACGEGLMPTTVSGLQALGIDRSALVDRAHPISGVRYVSPAGVIASADFSEGPGAGVRRTDLSELLLSLGRTLPLLTILENGTARLVRRGDEFGVRVKGTTLLPRLVVGADGLNSAIRKAAGIGRVLRGPVRWGVRQHFAVHPWTDRVEVQWARSMEAYVTPIRHDAIGIAVLADGSVKCPPRPSSVRALLSHFPDLRRRLAGAEPTSEARGAGPFHQCVPNPTRDNLVLVGDAAGYVDAITGEGVGLALSQAQSLSRLGGGFLQEGSRKALKAELARVARLQHLAARENHRLTRSLLWLRRHPRLLERCITALALEPGLFQHFLSANMGNVPCFRPPVLPCLGFLKAMGWPAPSGTQLA